MTGLALPALMAMVLSAGLISTAAASGTPTASTTAAADYLPAKEGNENANARPHRDPTIVRHIASAICRVNLEGVPALGVLCSAFENAGLIDEALRHQRQTSIGRQRQRGRRWGDQLDLRFRKFIRTHCSDPSRTTTSRRGPDRTIPVTHTVQQSPTAGDQCTDVFIDVGVNPRCWGCSICGTQPAPSPAHTACKVGCRSNIWRRGHNS